MRSTKKTVSLFQSHVFKHEFFLFPVARSLFPLKVLYLRYFWLKNSSNIHSRILTYEPEVISSIVRLLRRLYL